MKLNDCDKDSPALFTWAGESCHIRGSRQTAAPKVSSLDSYLYPVDVALFRAVNHGLSHPWADSYFKLVTDWNNFRYVIAAWFLGWIIWGGRRGRVALIALLLSVVIADLVSSHFLKDVVQRVRPCNALTDVVLPLGKRLSFSFPSSHGTTMGAAAISLTIFFRRWWPLWYFIAGSVGLSRIYLGLHYPSDVMAGYLFGTAMGTVVAFTLTWAFSIDRPRRKPAVETPEAAAEAAS